MGRGPGSIYKICKAQAIDTAKSLAVSGDKDDIISRANNRYKCYTLLETDVKRVFFKENYSDKTTEKALRQWGDLQLTARRVYERYSIVIFLETLQEGA